MNNQQFRPEFPEWLDQAVFHNESKALINRLSDTEVQQLSEREIKNRCVKAYHRKQRQLTAIAQAQVATDPFRTAARQFAKG